MHGPGETPKAASRSVANGAAKRLRSALRSASPIGPGAIRAPSIPRRPAIGSGSSPYIWPDQAERLATTKAALDAAAAAPWRVERADAGPWIEERLGEDATGRTRVLAHTIVWQYLPQGTKGQVERAVRSAAERATAQSPLAWFSMEADGDARGAALNLSLWPGGEDRFLGRADFHGRWIDWG